MPLRYHARRRRAEPPSPAAPHRPPAHELDWADVAQLPLCLLSRDMQNRQTLDKVFAATGATPNVVLQANAVRVLLVECLSGRAFSIMPMSTLPNEYEGAGLRAHPILPEHAEDVCLVRPRRDTQPALSQAAWQIASQLDLEAVLNEPLGKTP